jgi:hypothetical protein
MHNAIAMIKVAIRAVANTPFDGFGEGISGCDAALDTPELGLEVGVDV